ncbi:hypothetical protein L249_4000 [Ophiocordyceps polyrhachis-furcata BCC 54312]|uniref:Uncharacterized protein n=1 Tax=Ophiocordyceps polyrhachis-furcata BCC 54312 TaxID=1330021 RepID=A0A367L5A5_9HYPO|nr:hypothetical protein L249_4000 [Ophiocordyceps polyrhachis-furcata BCC 54312]
MAFSSGGAFRTGGAHHGLFRPPLPPSSSACLPAGRRGLEKRRPRYGATSPSRRNVVTEDDEDDQKLAPKTPNPAPAIAAATTTAAVHNYALAGHLDTPHSGPEDGSLLDESMYSDSNYRKALGSKRPHPDFDVADPSRPTPLFSLPAEPMPQRTWSALALDTIGDVVGRVWDFCTAGAFRGFYAGGGEGYYVPPEEVSYCGGVEKQVPGHYPRGSYSGTSDVGGPDGGPTSMPMMMGFDGGDYDLSSPTFPAAKRRQTSMADELGRNWVMVHEPREGNGARRRTSFQRARTRGVVTGRRGTLPIRPHTMCVSSSISSSGTTPWSGAAERSWLAAPPAPARSPSPKKQSSRASTTTMSAVGGVMASTATTTASGGNNSRRRTTLLPGTAHGRTHSNASTASSRGAADEVVEASPRLDAEAKKLAARRKMEERDADVRIEAFNKQLQAMIRQGREALGTMIEVDGGWEDDE